MTRRKILWCQDTRLFSETEETQLQSVFGVNSESLSLLLDGCSYVFEQAAFQGVGAEALYEQLLGAGIDDSHAKVFGRQWNNERASFITKLKQRTLGASSLQNTDYHLNLSMGDSSLSKLQDPSAIFELTLSSQSTSEVKTCLFPYILSEFRMKNLSWSLRMMNCIPFLVSSKISSTSQIACRSL